MTKPAAKFAIHIIMTTGLAYFASGSIAQVTPPETAAQANALVGVWGVEEVFGPAVRGGLTIDTHTRDWHAKIGKFDVPLRREQDAITFSLPSNEGEFRGHLSADGKALTGDWIQPPGVVNNNRYATPVHFVRSTLRYGRVKSCRWTTVSRSMFRFNAGKTTHSQHSFVIPSLISSVDMSIG